jgi:hypothetical protein
MRTTTVFLPSGSFVEGAQIPGGPKIFLQFRNLKTNFGSNPAPLYSSGAEAAPFYAGITLVRSGSGIRVKDFGGYTVTQTISYSQSHTFDRIVIADQTLTISSSTQLLDGRLDVFEYDDILGAGSLPNDDETYFRNWGCKQRNLFFGSDPKKHHLLFNGLKEFTNIALGDEEIVYDSGTPSPITNDLFCDLTFKCPFFYQNDETLPEFDQWNCKIGATSFGFSETDDFGIDVTGYSATKWRDLRDTYTLTVDDVDINPSWDTNSVVHTVEWTIF